MKRIIENVFIGVVIASNVSLLVQGIITDTATRAPIWVDALFILGAVLASYWWARFLIWLATLAWRGLSKRRTRREVDDPTTSTRSGTGR